MHCPIRPLPHQRNALCLALHKLPPHQAATPSGYCLFADRAKFGVGAQPLPGTVHMEGVAAREMGQLCPLLPVLHADGAWPAWVHGIEHGRVGLSLGAWVNGFEHVVWA